MSSTTETSQSRVGTGDSTPDGGLLGSVTVIPRATVGAGSRERDNWPVSDRETPKR